MLAGLRYVAHCDPEVLSFIANDLPRLSFADTCAFYAEMEEGAIELNKHEIAVLGCNDRFFLLTSLLNRPDAIHPWLFARCREVEADPDEHLDLWSREHYKSTIITFGGIIQEILRDPEITIGIFSVNKDVSTAFCSQIMQELTQNETLRDLYSDVLWDKPRSQTAAAKVPWGATAFTVRRKTNPKEATVEAHGLIDAMPTGRHFRLRVYDDVVTEKHLSPDMIKKVTERWELSDNLGGGEQRRWHIGTRYSFADTYGQILDRNILKVRLFPATDDGTINGNPVLFSPKVWAAKKATQRTTINAQLLQNPLGDNSATFQGKHLRSTPVRPRNLNIYIMADPSRGNSAKSDRTAIAVVGVDPQGNKYLLDGYRHRMKLSERWTALSGLYERWSQSHGVGMCEVGYERYGAQSDDQYFSEKMDEQKNQDIVFPIKELNWTRDGTVSKAHRVERLEPNFRLGKFFLAPRLWHGALGECFWRWDDVQNKVVYTQALGPTKLESACRAQGEGYRVMKPILRKDEDGNLYDVTVAFMEEYQFFPFAPKDDLIDAVSRIYDMSPEPAIGVGGELDEAMKLPAW